MYTPLCREDEISYQLSLFIFRADLFSQTDHKSFIAKRKYTEKTLRN